MSNIKIILAVLAYSLFSCKSYEHLAGTHVTNVRVTSDTDTAIAALILPYKKAMDAQMNEVIAQCPASLFKEKPESGLTNWVTDALYRQSVKAFSEPIAFVFQNFGGIRVPNLGKGDITLSKIFELMPFDNAQVLVKLSGADVLKFFEYIAEMGGSPVSSNVMMKIKDNKLLEVTLAGKSIDPAKSYFVALPDYIANGGDNQTYLQDKPRIDKNILVRDLLIQDAKEQGLITAKKDGRITVE
ncbi:MAG: 5'-nucleotidase C-terminal domain-containing protein [Saprospiraceae bacterium]|nr:5'-nucleotidase C-terminal domain-containing protein [Saprospiraceae bacterium]